MKFSEEMVSIQHRAGNPMSRGTIVSRWAIHGRLTVAVYSDRHPCHRTPDPVVSMKLHSYKKCCFIKPKAKSRPRGRGLGLTAQRSSSFLGLPCFDDDIDTPIDGPSGHGVVGRKWAIRTVAESGDLLGIEGAVGQEILTHGLSAIA